MPSTPRRDLVTVTKLESAGRLVDFAIRTVLNDEDAVAAVAMVGSAAIVAENLVTSAGGKPFADHAEATFPFGRFKNYRAMTREPFNFIKHAQRAGDNQPDATLTFGIEDIEGLLMAAITDLRYFRDCTPTEVAYIVWKLSTRKSLLPADPRGLRDGLPADVEALPRLEQLARGRQLVKEFQSREPSGLVRALLPIIAPQSSLFAT